MLTIILIIYNHGLTIVQASQPEKERKGERERESNRGRFCDENCQGCHQLKQTPLMVLSISDGETCVIGTTDRFCEAGSTCDEVSTGTFECRPEGE